MRPGGIVGSKVGGGQLLTALINSMGTSWSTNFVCGVDFSDTTCYSGTGQAIEDLKAFDLTRGATNGASSDDPTFVSGSALDSYFDFDGTTDLINYLGTGGTPANLDTAIASSSIVTWIGVHRHAPGSGLSHIMWLSNTAESNLAVLSYSAADKLTAHHDGSVSTSSASAIVGAATRGFVVCMDRNVDNVRFVTTENGGTVESIAKTMSGGGGTTTKYKIGEDGGGGNHLVGRLYLLGCLTGFRPTDAEMTTAFGKLKKRFPAI